MCISALNKQNKLKQDRALKPNTHYSIILWFWSTLNPDRDCLLLNWTFTASVCLSKPPTCSNLSRKESLGEQRAAVGNPLGLQGQLLNDSEKNIWEGKKTVWRIYDKWTCKFCTIATLPSVLTFHICARDWGILGM